jgi:hypothetical protein
MLASISWVQFPLKFLFNLYCIVLYLFSVQNIQFNFDLALSLPNILIVPHLQRICYCLSITIYIILQEESKKILMQNETLIYRGQTSRREWKKL